MAYYFPVDPRTGASPFRLARVAPINYEETSFSDEILGLSPAFVEIYNQAMVSESADLDQMVGMGLRKALEFLFKDYAIQMNPDKSDEILKMSLGKCIKDFSDDTRLEACAKRANWLGNDETHYVRKWEDKDLNHLKLLIQLTINWIENVLRTEAFIEDMS